MRIGIATVQVPFIHGGSGNLASGLAGALREAGHASEIITMPFRFSPTHEVLRSMEVWAGENFEQMNGYGLDRVICLAFPTYCLKHPRKVPWLMHQYRAVYELWDTPYAGDLSGTHEGKDLRERIFETDTRALGAMERVFTISKRVCERLERYNGVSSRELYHPPMLPERFYTGEAEPFIFMPSRLEDLKRQRLLIEAMPHLPPGVAAIIAGEGGSRPGLERLVAEKGLQERVRFVGRVTHEEMCGLYAHCLGVFFGPYDEDYGYVTLEAMLSAKPVITCRDSGGPTEFVRDGVTGYIVDPEPEAVAHGIRRLQDNRRQAAELGRNGLDQYYSLDLSWDRVVETLLR